VNQRSRNRTNRYGGSLEKGDRLTPVIGSGPGPGPARRIPVQDRVRKPGCAESGRAGHLGRAQTLARPSSPSPDRPTAPAAAHFFVFLVAAWEAVTVGDALALALALGVGAGLGATEPAPVPVP
jgi:hypothetical protein